VPGKTNSDAIRDLEHQVAKLIERSDNDRRDFARLDSLISRIAETVDAVRIQAAIFENKHTEFKLVRDEKDRRRWMVWMALVGSLSTLAVNIALVARKK
jgi:hypothetical protein